MPLPEVDLDDEGAVVYVVGGSRSRGNPGVRGFPIIEWDGAESRWSHVVSVAKEVRKAMRAGGTHLLVPRAQADWLAENPLLIEYFAARHQVVEASEEAGVLFELREFDA